MVRTKISQSSALRPKRGHTAVSQRPDSTEPEAPVGLSNTSPCSQPERNGLLHANGTTGEPQDTVQELDVTDNKEEEEGEEEDSVSTESLSEVSKFESEFTFSYISHCYMSLEAVPNDLPLCHPVPSPDLSFQPDEHLEVYVSASENPNHFWIQILGVRSLQLDKLTEEMTRFYNSGNPTVRTTPYVSSQVLYQNQ